MVKFTFKPFKSQKATPADPNTTGELQNPYQRRREQVRRAQKTHRERKEAYMKSLETEVIQLRANEARLFRETKGLYAEINAMKMLLAKNGIPIPPCPPLSLSPQDETNIEAAPIADELFEFSILEKAPKQQHERIHVRRQTRRGGNREGDSITSSIPQSQPGPITFDAISYSPNSTFVCQQDPTAIGMDFILSLEAPCLGHIPQTLDNDSPSGHALTASATLLHHQHDHLSVSDQTQLLGLTSTWTVPSSSVERLLELSSSIPLDGEVTPVQAWDCIRRHPQYATLACARLEELKAALVVHVKCHGFGGVLAQDVFEEKLWDMFSEGYGQ